MKRLALYFLITALPAIAMAQSSFYFDYKSFFGKEDRIGLFSDEAKARFSNNVLKSISANTLLMDCGSKGKPATGFLLQSKDGPQIVTAAHNVQLATSSQPCRARRYNEYAVKVSDFKISADYQDSATLTDVGFDVAKAHSTTLLGGFKVCETIDMTAAFIVPQSYDGKGYLALPPLCRATKISGNVITTNCRGHYKASGAPLLLIKNENVCVAGVFNAHSGRLMNYESYAANIISRNPVN